MTLIYRYREASLIIIAIILHLSQGTERALNICEKKTIPFTAFTQKNLTIANPGFPNSSPNENMHCSCLIRSRTPTNFSVRYEEWKFKSSIMYCTNHLKIETESDSDFDDICLNRRAPSNSLLFESDAEAYSLLILYVRTSTYILDNSGKFSLQISNADNSGSPVDSGEVSYYSIACDSKPQSIPPPPTTPISRTSELPLQSRVDSTTSQPEKAVASGSADKLDDNENPSLTFLIIGTTIGCSLALCIAVLVLLLLHRHRHRLLLIKKPSLMDDVTGMNMTNQNHNFSSNQLENIYELETSTTPTFDINPEGTVLYSEVLPKPSNPRLQTASCSTVYADMSQGSRNSKSPQSATSSPIASPTNRRTLSKNFFFGGKSTPKIDASSGVFSDKEITKSSSDGRNQIVYNNVEPQPIISSQPDVVLTSCGLVTSQDGEYQYAQRYDDGIYDKPRTVDNIYEYERDTEEKNVLPSPPEQAMYLNVDSTGASRIKDGEEFIQDGGSTEAVYAEISEGSLARKGTLARKDSDMIIIDNDLYNT